MLYLQRKSNLNSYGIWNAFYDEFSTNFMMNLQQILWWICNKFDWRIVSMTSSMMSVVSRLVVWLYIFSKIILEISNLKIVLFECTNKFYMSKANNHHSTSFESKIPFQLLEFGALLIVLLLLPRKNQNPEK